MNEPIQFPAPPVHHVEHGEDRLTEAGAAARFVRLHGDDVRFIHPRGHWLVWDSHRWVRDLDAAVQRRALDFVHVWQHEAVDLPRSERRDAILEFVVKLERRPVLTNVLALAAAMKPIADDGKGWDADPMVLGVRNGVIDLHTGLLRDGRREDRITMAAGVAFDPDAICPRWEQFLDEVFNGSDEMTAFLWRAIGYSLTGSTTEQALFLLHGHGANGKSTLLLILSFVLGDYAWTMPMSTVELHQRSSIPNDLAALAGRRFVRASESQDGSRLNESRVKALTGSDTISARFLHAEYFEFDPVAKFWLACNHKPVVRDDSHGFWRRIRLIPFTQTFDVNATLADELKSEASGILAWMVRGALAWQADGLHPPAAVTDATADYAAESDPFSQFLTEACEVVEGSQIYASDLFSYYRHWADAHGLTERERLTATSFGRKAGERLQRGRDVNGKFYLGIARK